MTQVIHIFRKDTRLCWLEILLSVASLVVMVLVYPLRWTVWPAKSVGAMNDLNMNTAVLCTGLSALIVVSWAVLVGRVVHAEGLVGKKHFWLTRPYEWKSLLAAKLLFLVVYLYVPLVIAQWLLLAIAGLSSLSVVPGLLFNLLLITGFLVLPLVAIAAITANLSRMILALFGAVLVCIAAVVVITLPGYSNRHNSFWSRLGALAANNLAAPAHSLTSMGHHSQLMLAMLFAIACGVVVVLQYARRKTNVGWMILIALPIVIAVGGLVKAHRTLSGQVLIDRDYAVVSGTDAPMEITSGIDEQHLLTVFRATNDQGEPFAGVRIPVHISDIAEGTSLSVDQFRVTIEAPDGFRWSDDLHDATIPARILPGTVYGGRGANVYFEIPYATYKRFGNGRVAVRVTLAVTRLQAGKSVTVTMPTHETVVPDLGICAIESTAYGAMQCRSALREPDVTYVSASGWSDAPCELGAEIQLAQVNPWVGHFDREPAEFGIAPIQFVHASYSWGRGPASFRKHLCAGTPVTFTQYKFRDRVQVNFTIPDLYFPPENPASNVDRSDGRAH